MANSKPKISVGILSYNRKDYLAQALQSLDWQGDLVDEIIVVDDGSTDGTPEFLSSLSNPKLRFFPLKENVGRPIARNKVVENMNGDFLLWLDDDDAFIETTLITHLECLKQNPDADIIFGNLMVCDEQLNPQRVLQFKPIPTEAALSRMIFENIVPNGGTLIRRSVFDRVGPYNKDFKRAQDYEFWSRTALAGCKYAYHDDITYLYRFHAQNLSNPEHIRPQSKYHCLILENILKCADIEVIFPTLDWKKEPEKSMSLAMLTIAKIFFDHGDDKNALECAEISTNVFDSSHGLIIKGLILRAMGKSAEAADILASVIDKIAPQYSCMHVEVGAPRGSEAVAEKAKEEKSISALRDE